VVIVTICVHQGAQILLLPSDDKLRSSNSKNYVFNAAEGDVYVLSGNARNIFDHGVVCEHQKRSVGARKIFGEDEETNKAIPKKKKKAKKGEPKNIGRESLNLRFCIHGNKQGMPFYVGDEMPIR
jgi:hypothetical protein